jgi:hypothetical protein
MEDVCKGKMITSIGNAGGGGCDSHLRHGLSVGDWTRTADRQNCRQSAKLCANSSIVSIYHHIITRSLDGKRVVLYLSQNQNISLPIDCYLSEKYFIIVIITSLQKILINL